MRSACSIAWASRIGRVALAAAWLGACQAPQANDVAGSYRHEGAIAATLEVRHLAGQYAVRLEGGGSSVAGVATPADCVIEASGALAGAVLRARFGPVESDTFAYSAAQAAREDRRLEIVFEPGAAAVVAADTLGYCGWGAEFAGRYRMVGPAARLEGARSRALTGAAA